MNDIKIERLTAADYDEWLAVIDRVFTIQNRRYMDFEVELPKMCVRDDEHMGKHFAVKKNGKIVSSLGVYPLPMKVAGEDILFSTMGNVVTVPEEEGHGYMTQLLEVAMTELATIGADASRLCGDRMRYNRYGYEYAGFLYNFEVLKSHLKRKFTGFKSDISFVRVDESDTALISEMKKIYEMENAAVVRKNNYDFLKTLCAWKNKPYAAVKNDGSVIGYISVSEKKDSIAEISAISPEAFRELLVYWIITKGEKVVSIGVMPHKVEQIHILSELCQECNITNPSMFKIMNWEKVVNAFFKLKAQYTCVPDGELVIGIENYGNLLLSAENNNVSCVKTEQNPDISLSGLEATRLIFGTYPEQSVADFSHPFLPLPLSWNSQDRV